MSDQTPTDLLLAMAEDWTDPVVVRDAPERVPHVIEQLIERVSTLTARCEALTAERDSWKSQVDEAKARFDRDLQNYSSGYTQALDDALKGKP